MARAIFHAHTNVSHDATPSLEEIVRKVVPLGVDTLILTDHNKLPKNRTHPDITIIPGEEINTQEGEIIGIFLKEEIAAWLPLTETLDQIHKQGGLAIAPHPFDRLRRKVLTHEALESHINDIDIIEDFNARSVFASDTAYAWAFARKHMKPTIHGSDAHTLYEYGLNWIDNINCDSPKKFLASLHDVRYKVKKAPLFVHGVTKYVKWSKKYFHQK